MPSFISHLHLKDGLGDTLPLGDVVTTLKTSVAVNRMAGAAVADNGDAIVMWTEETGSGALTQLAPWVARRVNGEWLQPERLVSPSSPSTNAFQYGRCVGIGTDGTFYAAVSGFQTNAPCRIYRNTGSGWSTLGGDLNYSTTPKSMLPRANGVMAVFFLSGYNLSARRVVGNTISPSSTVWSNVGVYGRSQTIPIQGTTSGRIDAVLSFAVASSFNDGQTWANSSDDPFASEAVWSSWIAPSGALSVVSRRSSDVNTVRTFYLSRRDASGAWMPNVSISSTGGTSQDVSGLRVAGDWVIYRQDEGNGTSSRWATYARKIAGSTAGSPILLIKDPALNESVTSVDSILRYSDGAYVGEMFTPSGFTYITSEGGEWNPRTVPQGFETATGSLLTLSPGRNYSLGFVMATNEDAATPGLQSNLLATVHRRPA